MSKSDDEHDTDMSKELLERIAVMVLIVERRTNPGSFVSLGFGRSLVNDWIRESVEKLVGSAPQIMVPSCLMICTEVIRKFAEWSVGKFEATTAAAMV